MTDVLILFIVVYYRYVYTLYCHFVVSKAGLRMPMITDSHLVHQLVIS